MRLVAGSENLRGQAEYHPDFFTHLSFSLLEESIPWQQNRIRIFGKDYPEPRLTAWFGPAYTYSGIQWPASAMPDFLSEMAIKLTDFTGFEFNAVLANYYRNGRDSMGWHRDNEPEMDTSLIASLSFGASRIFKIRERASRRTHSLELENASLLLMRDMQDDWEHAIMKTTKETGPRINLTFRRIRV